MFRSYLWGCFFLKNNRNPTPDLRLLLRAILAWLVAAFVLLLLSAFVLSRIGVGSAVLGYVSSGISFLAAAAAGITLGRDKRNGLLARSLLAALILVVILLTAGFLVGDREISSSAVLSVISFSFAGTLVGASLSGGRRPTRRQSSFRAKSRTRI